MPKDDKKLCKDCGSDQVFCDSRYHETQVVCHNCGLVSSNEQVFDYSAGPTKASTAHSSSFSSSRRHNLYFCRTRSKQHTATKQLALSKIDFLASTFKFDACSKAEAIRMLNSSCDTEPFKWYREIHKICLAGCCAYLVARRTSSGSIPLDTVSDLLGVPRNELIGVYKELQRGELFEMKSSVVDVGTDGLAAVDGYVKELGLEGSKRMSETALKLIKICKKTLVATGVHPKPLFAAAIYAAWTVDTLPIRNVPFKVFCKQVGIPYGSSIQRWNEMMTVLIEISNQIPFYKEGTVNRKNLLLHLDTILKYPNALTADREKRASEPPILTVVTNMRPKRKPSELEPDVSEREPIADGHLDSEELTEKDIPDDQMDRYLRTPKEINDIQLLKKRFYKN